jgi:pimeloyl-ACP methyl ester carboxylesterase
MIHGYGGGGAVFSKMIAHMSNYYEVITIDLLGMGASGRPDFGLTGF